MPPSTPQIIVGFPVVQPLRGLSLLNFSFFTYNLYFFPYNYYVSWIYALFVTYVLKNLLVSLCRNSSKNKKMQVRMNME